MTGLLKTIAPMLGTALGGPLGGLAVEAIGNALGLSDATEASVKRALQGATATDMLALKKAEQEFTFKMQELGYKNVADLEAIAAGDRNSARAREMAVRDRTPSTLAFVVTLGFFGVLSYLISEGVPAEGGEALLVMLGSLGTAWTGIIAYYFGSSAGSARKDIIAGMNK